MKNSFKIYAIINYKYSILFLILTVFSSCGDCDDPEFIDYQEYIENYFEVYKQGSYFLYLNRDGTKSDSIYISEYGEGTRIDKVLCVETPYRVFTLNSDYLSLGKKICCNYENGSFNATSSCALAYDRDWNIYGINNQDTLIIDIINNPAPGKIDSFQAWPDTGQTIFDVWVYDSGQGAIYFAPNIGIVQYITPNNTDTFTITKVYIP